jgi:hypothetical protein
MTRSVDSRAIAIGGGAAALLLFLALAFSPWLAVSAALGLLALGAAVPLAIRRWAEEHGQDAGAVRVRRRLGLLTVVCAGLMSTLMTVLIPPLQSPDENSHLRRAYSVLDGAFFIARILVPHQ